MAQRNRSLVWQLPAIVLVPVVGRYRGKPDQQTTKPASDRSAAPSHRGRPSLTEMSRGFFEDKLRIAVMFGLYSLVCFGIWLYLDDEGALVFGILCAGFGAQQYYRHVLQKRESEDANDR